MEIAKDKVDEAILALLWLNQHVTGVAWKGFDWATMNRLHERGLISDPARRRKSVWFTEEGDAAAENAFRSLFSSGNDETSESKTTP